MFKACGLCGHSRRIKQDDSDLDNCRRSNMHVMAEKKQSDVIELNLLPFNLVRVCGSSPAKTKTYCREIREIR
jgi:hypothetical protein